MDRKNIIDNLDKKLRRWDIDFNRSYNKALSVSNRFKDAGLRHLARLRDGRARIRHLMQCFWDVSEDAVFDVRMGIDEAWQDLQAGLYETNSYFLGQKIRTKQTQATTQS